MDVVQLYQDYNIQAQTEGHKHCRPGWINTECPFCTGNPGLHLGATLDGKIFYCWRCGIHYPDESIAKLLGINQAQARKIILEYAGVPSIVQETKFKIHLKAHRFPSNTAEMLEAHRRYLVKRNFDPDYLEKEWNLLGTGVISTLDHTDYSRRIVAPIYWEDKQVTFQARDITGKHPMKYLACMKERELIHHKHIIYLHPEFKGSTIIITEGITDVWRFGRYAGATFGIEYTRQQVRLMAKLFKRVAVCFDDESQAIKQAEELIKDLQFRGIDSFRIPIVGDPGGMDQKEANYIVKQLIYS